MVSTKRTKKMKQNNLKKAAAKVAAKPIEKPIEQPKAVAIKKDNKVKVWFKNLNSKCSVFFKKIGSELRGWDWQTIFNVTLLIGIIALFIVLIIQTVKPGTSKIQPATNTGAINNVVKFENVQAEQIIQQNITLPLNNTEIEVVKKPKNKKCISDGNVTIDGELPASKRICSKKIQGDLYLQNMYKYNMPCDIHVTGDLFVRNVGQLRFCNSFTVEGNIYVSHNSSFGPIPKSAIIGGQIIL